MRNNAGIADIADTAVIGNGTPKGKTVMKLRSVRALLQRSRRFRS
jgi:hypothetical protein